MAYCSGIIGPRPTTRPLHHPPTHPTNRPTADPHTLSIPLTFTRPGHDGALQRHQRPQAHHLPSDHAHAAGDAEGLELGQVLVSEA